MFDLIQIRMRLTGAREAAVEAKAASTAIAGTGTAAAAAGAKSGRAAVMTTRFTSALRTLGRTAIYVGTAGLAALGFEAFRAVGAYREARKVGQQTNAVIKSTGGIANASAKDVAALASSLSLKTGVDDEEVQSATNMLLTFTKVRNEAGKGNNILDQTTEATLDLAAATKTDAVSAAKQLGKALNDPTTGLTALRRSGASFNTEQTEMITKLFESGERLKAQKLILAELTNEFGGSAKANHDAVDRLGVAWENLEEKGGKVLFPTIRKGIVWLTDFIKGLESGKGPGGAFADTLSDVGDAVGSAVTWIKGAASWVGKFVDKLLHGGGEVGAFGQDIKQIGLAIKDVAVTVFPLFLSYAKKLWSGFKSAFGGIADAIQGTVKIIGGILRGDWSRVWEGAKQLLSGTVQAIIGIVKTMTAPFRTVFGAIGGFIKDKLEGPFGWFFEKVGDVVDFLQDAINKGRDLIALLPFISGPQADLTGVGSAIGGFGATAGGAGLGLGLGGGGGGGGKGGGGHTNTPRLAPRKSPTPTQAPSGRGTGRRRERLQPVQLMLNGRVVAETTLRIGEDEAVLA